MQISKSTAGLLAKAGIALAAAAAFGFASPAVHAQTSTSANTIGAIRFGAYITTDTNARKVYGKYMPTGGLDYAFQQNGDNERAILSVDYMDYSHAGNNWRIIPVTVGQQMISSPHAQHVRPYVGYGVGAYFVHLKNPGNQNFNGSDTVNDTKLGGYLNAGLDLSTNLFVDARYHITGPTHGQNTDGLELTAGIRF